MTARELAEISLNDSLFQIEKCVADLPSPVFDAKPIATAMSFRETLVHLIDVSGAVISASKGEKYKWGSFTGESMSPEALMERFEADREVAATAALGMLGEKPELATGYLAAHESYHVGQLALLRMMLDPGWDPMSIYNH